MLARRRQSFLEQKLGLRGIGYTANAFELVVDFVMILTQVIQLAPVGQGVD